LNVPSRFQEEGMTHRTHAVAKTRSHQVRWSSRCRSRAAGAEAGSAAGSRGAAAAGRGRTAQLRLSSASTLVVGSPQLQRSSHALLRPQESKCDACKTYDWNVIHESHSSPFIRHGEKHGGISEAHWENLTDRNINFFMSSYESRARYLSQIACVCSKSIYWVDATKISSFTGLSSNLRKSWKDDHQF